MLLNSNMWQNAVRLPPRVITPLTAPARPCDTTRSTATSDAGPRSLIPDSTASWPRTGFSPMWSQTSSGNDSASTDPTSAHATATEKSSSRFCLGEFPQSELRVTLVATFHQAVRLKPQLWASPEMVAMGTSETASCLETYDA